MGEIMISQDGNIQAAAGQSDSSNDSCKARVWVQPSLERLPLKQALGGASGESDGGIGLS